MAVLTGVALASTSMAVAAVAPAASAQGATDPAPITLQSAVRAATPAGISDPSYYGMDLADVNGDGTPDAAAPVVFNVPGVGVRNVVHVQLGQGDGTFDAPTFEADLPVTGGPGPGSIYYGMRVVFGSFTGDTSLDLAATHVGSAAIFIFEGNGDGTFDAPTQVPLSFFPSSLRAGDLDSDGTDDLVAGWAWGTPGPVRLAVLTSTAPGAWSTQEIDPGATMADIAIADVDGVGGDDLVVGRDGADLAIYANDGFGGFPASPATIPGTSDRRSVAVGDVDGDGDSDILALNGFGIAEVQRSDGAGGWSVLPGDEVRLPTGYANGAPQVMTDLTGDGRVDVAVPTGRAVAVLHVDGAGVLQAEQWVPGSRDDVGGGNQSVSAVEPTDVDGDGRLDLVTALAMTNGGSRPGELTSLLGDTRSAPGRFLAPQAVGRYNDGVSSGGDARSHALGDMDGDGDLDLVTHTDNSFGARTKVRFGNGDRTFGPPQIMGQVGGTCGAQAKVWLADYDGDDNLDVLCLNGTAQVAFGDGAGNVGSSTPLPLNTTGLSGGVGRTFAHDDFDADGHQDVVFMVTNNCCPFGEPWVGHLVIQRYDPTNPRNFVTDGVGVDLGQVSGPEGVAAGDFDEDGLPDVVVHTNRLADGSGGERFMFFKGGGDGTLAAPVTTAPGLPTYAQVEAADVDGDGHLDLVGSGGNNGSVGVVLGNGDGTFGAATTYGADANFDLTLADLNGDGQRDVVTGSWNHGVTVFAARTDGTLLPAGYHPTADQRVDGVLTGDLDGDGKPEVVTTVGTDPHVTVLENTSAFGPPATDPDLRPTTVTAPNAIEAGVVGDITYTVQNQGAPIVGGSWVDRVYLSTDASWDPGDRLFFSVARSGDLQQGASYSQTVSAPFVPVVPGQTKVIVRSDLFDAVDEADEANNLLVMPGSVDVTVPTLAPGVDEDVTVADGELRYRRIDASSDDQQLGAALDVDGAAELVVADGRLPTSTDHDHASPTLDQPTIALPANSGARFLLLRGASGAGGGIGATLSLRTVGFAVLGVEPATGSNQGEATTVVRGGGFAADATVAIDDGGAHREASTVTRLADGSLEVTFDLTGLPVGTYDVTVTNPGPVSATLADAYEVTDEAAGGLEVLLTTPGLMRTNWVTDAVVTVRNTGGTDQELPVVFLDSTGGAVFRPAGSATFVEDPIAVVPRDPGGAQRRLPPHAVVDVRIPFLPSAATLDAVLTGGAVTVHFDARLQRADSDDAIDLASRLDPYRPVGLTDETWDAVRTFALDGAQTWGDYVALLTAADAEARGFGRTPAGEADLLQHLVDRAMVFAPDADVRGTVRLGDGSPAVEGTVRLAGVAEPSRSPIWPDGSYALRDVEPATGRLEVDGYVQDRLPAVTVGADPVEVDIAVRRGETIKGFVTRAGDGAGVEGARVTVLDEVTGKLAEATTDADGFYQARGNRVGLPPVRITADGYLPFGPTTVPVDEGADATLHATLGVGGAIAGMVTLPGGAPAAGATVVAESDTGEQIATGTTASDGTYALALVGAGAYTVTASAPGTGRVTATGVVVTDDMTTDLDLALTAPASISGTVRDPAGQPVGDAVVRTGLPGTDDPRTITAADGTFTLVDLPGGAVAVLAEADGYQTTRADVTLTTGGAATQDLTLEPFATVGGLVQDGDLDPIAGVQVVVVDAMGLPFTTTTGPDGRFAVDHLLYGDYTASVYAGAAGATATVDADDPVADLTITAPIGRVEGRVVDGSGQPRADVAVQLRADRPDAAPVAVVTDSDGRYGFDLVIDGDVELVASAFGWGSASVGGVAVVPGSVTTVADLAPGTATLHVAVGGPSPGADPVEGAIVRVVPDGLSDDPDTVTALAEATDASGVAAFAGLAPGTYTVEVSGAGLATTTTDVVVNAPSTDTSIVPDAGRHLARSVLAPGGGPQVGASVVLRSRTTGRVIATQTDAFGAWHLDGLDDGLHDGWILASGAQALRLADLTPATDPTPSGSDALVAPTASLAGHVTRNGLPQVLAEVTLVDGGDAPIATTFTGPDGGYVFDVLPPNVPVNLRISFAGARTMAFGSPVAFGPGPNGLPDPSPAGPSRPIDVSAADAGPGDVTGPDPVAPPDAVPFEQLDPLALAKSWLDEANREPERLPEDDGHLEARLGELDPEWCPQLQDAWARAKYIEQLKDDQFANVVDTHQQLYWRTLNELGLAATQATIILGKLYLAVPQLQLAGARMVTALPQLGPRLAATVGDFGVFVAGAIVDVSSIVGTIGGYLIDGNFDAIGTALNGVTQTMNEIGARGTAISAAGATGLGRAVGALSPLSAFISIAYDVKGLVGQLDTILGTARDVLGRFTDTKSQYEDTFARYAEAVDAFTKVRAAGCKCPNGEPMPADAKCDKPPPPDPPAPPPPTDDDDDGDDDDGDDHAPSETTYLNSRDPNAIDGPAGSGPGRAITVDQPLGYTIHFENDPDASAPAQQVVVSTVLDADVDLDSVELGDVGFGSVRLEVPDGRRAIELTEPIDGTPYSVRVLGSLDVDTRTLTWTFTTIDPATGDLPTDPLAGFLPPNDTSPQGEGVIEYRARTTGDTPVGSTIDAQASIVFDDNDAIATNTWTNTIGVVLPGEAGGYHPLVPARLVDTRTGLGGSAVRLGPGETRTVQVAGLGGVPASGAAAAVLNVTAVSPSAATHLSVWPSGEPMPTASNVNVPAGQTVANLAMVRLGDGGAVELFNNAGSLDVVVDVSGWFDLGAGSTVGVPPSSPDAVGGESGVGSATPTEVLAEPDGSGSAYLPLDPVRIVDTRDGTGGSSTKLAAGETRALTVTGVGGVPATGVTAVVLNVTAVFPSEATHLSLWPAGAAQPVVSNVNAPAGKTVPNLVVVRVGADGKVNLFNNSGAVDVVVDLAGYFADPTTAAIGEGPYRALDPARIVDTRDGTGGAKAKLGPGSTRSVTVSGVGGVPATGVTAVVLNVTAVFPTQASHLALWPSGTTQPIVSNLNVVPGVTVPNLVVVRVGADGKVNLYNNSGAVDVVIDVAGYIAG